MLVNPPFTLSECFRGFARVGSIQQPLGLAYVAAVLEEAGYNVKIIDSPVLGLSLQETVETVIRMRPDVVGITATTPTFNRAISLAESLKKVADIPLVIGGPHSTTLPDETLALSCFDIAIIGEGEYTMLELLKCLQKGTPLHEVKGIAFKERGQIVKTPPRAYIDDLDALPFPARHLLPPLKYYHPTPSAYRSLPQATMITSRGCPYQCTFCDRSVFGNKYRARSPKNVVDEVEELVYEYRAKEVRFWDDTFNINRKRVLEICREMLMRRLDISWTCLCRANLVDEEMLREMAKAGCWQVEYGIESGNEELLKKIGKGITLQQIKGAVEKTKAAGMKARGFFMLGLPGETEQTLRQTISFARSLKLDAAVFHITIPFPGTDLYLSAVSSGELRTDLNYQYYLMFGSDEVPYIPKGLTKEVLLKYRSIAYKSFYLRLSYMLEQLASARSLKDLFRYLLGFITLARIE
ncbi:MAG: radical SAM protein [Nitrososphaerales archaeon]